MNFKIRISLTKEYFSETYNQSVLYANKWTKYRILLSAICFSLGIYILYYVNHRLATPKLLLLFSVVVLISPLINKPFWMKNRMSSKVAGSDVEVVFSEEGILSNGPFSVGNMKWEGVERIQETPKGIFIWPQKGIHIYVPKSIASKELIDYILSKS